MHIFKWLFNKKYRFFQKKVSDVQKSLWELEFKVAKARAMREESRQGRDRTVEQVGNLTKTLNALTPEEKEQAVTLQTEIDNATAAIKSYEAQMQMVDDQVNGLRGEEPITGLLEHMDGLANLRELYKEHLSKI